MTHLAMSALDKIRGLQTAARAREELPRCGGFVRQERFQEIVSWWFEDGSRVWKRGPGATFRCSPPITA